MRLATFQDFYPVIPGPLEHTPLFYKLNLLNIFDIYKLQVGKLVYGSLNNLGPIHGILNFTRASEIHRHATRYSMQNNLHINPVRTCRFGLRTLNVEGVHLWATIPNNIKNCSTKQAFSKQLKANLTNSYTHYRAAYHLIVTFQTIIIPIFRLILLRLVIIIIVIIFYYHYYYYHIIIVFIIIIIAILCHFACMYVCMYV